MKKVILGCVLSVLGVTQGFSFFSGPVFVESNQVRSLIAQESVSAARMIDQVAHTFTQIEQIAAQINEQELLNSILGEYGLGEIGEYQAAYENLNNLGEAVSIDSLLSGIAENIPEGGLSVEDIFSDAFDGRFGTIEAPEEVDTARYQNIRTYEEAFLAAEETSARVTQENVVLAGEAAELRVAASEAENEATYRQLIDQAEATEAAIKRNNTEAEIAVANAEIIAEMVEDREALNEKAQLDKALEEERAAAATARDAFMNQEFIIN